MLSAHDRLAVAKLRRRLAAGCPEPNVVVVFESLVDVADRFSSCPSTASVWREMEFVVAKYEARREF